MILHLDPAELKPSTLHPPLSKSDALRALATAHALALPEPGLGLPGRELPEDVAVFAGALRALRPGGPRTIDCHDGGAPLRFALALAAATAQDEVVFTGSARLGERPHQPLIHALQAAGASVQQGSPWPLRVRPFPEAPALPRFIIDAHQSSQFASALLFAATARSRIERRAWTLELEGEVASAGYLALTLEWLRAAGVRVTSFERRIEVDATHVRSPSLPQIPPDWSSLAYLLLIAWRTGARVEPLVLPSMHPDHAILDLLSAVGLRVELAVGGATVHGRPTRGLRTSVAAFPDLALTLCALACALPEPSTLEEVDILRLKESDRVEGCRALVSAFGGSTRLEGGALRIQPPASLPVRTRLDAGGDHRRALAGTTLCVLLGVPLELCGAECVRKSFPDFYRELGVPA